MCCWAPAEILRVSNVDGDSGYVRVQVLTNHDALDRETQLAANTNAELIAAARKAVAGG
jgi:hypothetical protein